MVAAWHGGGSSYHGGNFNSFFYSTPTWGVFSENCRVWNEIFMVSVVGFWDDYEWFEIIWFYEKLSVDPRNISQIQSLHSWAPTRESNRAGEFIERDQWDWWWRCDLQVTWSMVLHNTEILLSNMSQFIFRWMGGDPQIHVSVWMIFVVFRLVNLMKVWLQLKETNLTANVVCKWLAWLKISKKLESHHNLERGSEFFVWILGHVGLHVP